MKHWIKMSTSFGFEKQTTEKTTTLSFFLKYEFLFVLIGVQDSGESGKAE